MKQLVVLTVMAIILIGVVVFLYSGDTTEAPTPTPTPTVEETPMPLPIVSGSKVAVTYSDSGYGPAEVKIKKGDIVVFDNKGSKMMWTASAVHPTHKAYPGSGIEKCGTQLQTDIFDACQGYGAGESWEFRFNETGTRGYHNHLQPNHTGTVIVE